MRVYVLLAALILTVGSSSFAETGSRHEATEDLMQYMKAPEALEEAKQRFRFLVEQMRSAGTAEGSMNPEERGIERKHIRKFFDQVDQEVTWDKIRPQFVAVFEEVFTEAEIAEALKFFKSPAGKAYLEKFPFLSRRLIETGQQAYGSVLLGSEERMKQVDDGIKKEIEELRARKRN